MEIIRRASRYADKTAVLKSGKVTTYKQLIHAAEDVNRQLQQRPNAKRDSSGYGPRIGIVAAPGPEYVAGTWAIWQAGGIVVPLATSHPPKELQYVLQDAGVSQVLAPLTHIDKVKDVAASHGAQLHALPQLGTQLTSEHPSTPSGDPGDDPASSLSDIITTDAEQHSGALIMYTSGTTGKPKGVLHTHRSIHAQLSCLLTAWRWRASDQILHSLPLHHTHGIINALYCAHAAGAAVHFLPRFSPTQVWSTLMQGQTSVLMGVPTMYALLLEAYDAMPAEQQAQARAAAARLRLTISGSSACPLPVMSRWRDLSGTTLLERYGMTEIGMALSNPLEGERRPGAVGLPLPGVTARIACSPEVQPPLGELLIKGDNLFQQYWNRPEATAESFTADGFFRTGDTATLAGSPAYYQLLGRTSVDIIKRGGYKISALHIESALLEHPQVAEVAVLGLPDDLYGERIVAVLAMKQQQQGQQQGEGEVVVGASDVELRGFCGDRLPAYQVPQEFVRVGGIARNAMGKVNKKQLVQELLQQRQQQ